MAKTELDLSFRCEWQERSTRGFEKTRQKPEHGSYYFHLEPGSALINNYGFFLIESAETNNYLFVLHIERTAVYMSRFGSKRE